MFIVEENPMGLEFVSDKFKSDLEVVRTAFNVDPESIQFASKDIARLILKENPMALEFVHDSLKTDVDVLNQAITND